MKICQLCAVDFTFYHFLLPLAEAEIAAGHEVVAVCADGPLVWMGIAGTLNHFVEPSAERQKQRGLRA